MNITYNGLSSSNRLLTFSEVPNILKLSETITGRKGIYNFIVNTPFQSSVTGDSQYYITFLDETITNVMNPKNARNKKFYIANDIPSTAASIAQALRCCPSIAAVFNIEHSDNEVELQAKTLGQKWTNVAHYLDTNISSSYMTMYGTDGTASPSSVYMSKVLVDVFEEDKYLTTLEKTFYNDECSFNMSPVLSTFTEFGKSKTYKFDVSTIGENGTFSTRGSVSGVTAYGYEANQSDRYKILNGNMLLLNTNRNQLRYVYGNRIDYSLLIGSSSASVSYVIKNAAKSQIYSDTVTVSAGSNGLITDTYFTIPSNVYTLASWVEITVGSVTAKFKVIKPLKATEYYQRVYWRNEYGGIEFFDFTGSKSESDSVDIETYEKNIFDMYENSEYEIKKIYSNDYKKQVKLTSHLLEAEGRYFANSLMRSKSVWTIINKDTLSEKKHFIIPKAIDVQEDGTYNNIYTVSLTYEYSQLS
jgi:hypothetical protein